MLRSVSQEWGLEAGFVFFFLNFYFWFFWPEYCLSPEANLLDIHYPVFLSALITRTQADERSDVPPGVCCG